MSSIRGLGYIEVELKKSLRGNEIKKVGIGVGEKRKGFSAIWSF